jgi:putative endopeptidase
MWNVKKIGFFLILLGMVGCASTKPKDLMVESSPAFTRDPNWGFDAAGQDLEVAACDNFYLFANGNWKRDAEIPAESTHVSLIEEVRSTVDEQIRLVVQAAEQSVSPTRAEKLVGDLYYSFMNSVATHAIETRPVVQHLLDVRRSKTRVELVRSMADIPTGLSRFLYRPTVEIDAFDPTSKVVHIAQSGIGLPNKRYYLNPEFDEVRRRYISYIERVLSLFEWVDPTEVAPRIVDFETRLAEHHWPLSLSRDSSKAYHSINLSEIEEVADGFPWRVWFEEIAVPSSSPLIVKEYDAIVAMSEEFAATDFDVLQAWAAFTYLDSVAPFMAYDLSSLNFEFHGNVVHGQTRPKSRRLQAYDLLDKLLPEALGEIYARQFDSQKVSSDVREIVDNVILSFDRRIQNSEWMANSTKIEARRKLEIINVKVGSPDVFWQYPDLELSRTDLYGNIDTIYRHNWTRLLEDLTRVVDTDQWPEMPYTVNARYRTSRNEITFPTAVLQKPFYDSSFDAAINYGSLGSIIGHEITHGFDNDGRKFDSRGLMRDWWDPTDSLEFEERSEMLVSQYEDLRLLNGRRIDGRQTLGENIADLGGVITSLDAYLLSRNGKGEKISNGYSSSQRFFLGWAQIWRSHFRDEFLENYLTTNTHAPFPARVNGVVRNIDAWYDAFGIRPDCELYISPRHRVTIW